MVPYRDPLKIRLEGSQVSTGFRLRGLGVRV